MAPDETLSVRPARVVLIGMMGSGKSSVGRALADRTGWPYHDNDDLLEAATGRTAKRLLAEDGEAALRDGEERALVDGLAIASPAVIAVAAGTVASAANRARLREGGHVVWLDARPDVLARRAHGGTHRPWLDKDPVGWFASAHRERQAWYREVADQVVDTGALSVNASVREILRALSPDG